MKLNFIPWYIKHLKKEYKRLKDLYKIETRNPTVTIAEGVQILNRKRLFLGKHIYIDKGTILHCGGGAWSNFEGKIVIGNHVYIGPYCVLLGAGEIEIKDRVQIGPGVKLIAQSLHSAIRYNEELLDEETPPHEFAKITLEEGALIGAGSIILEGVTVGKGGVVAAGSVISRDVEPYTIVMTARTRSIKRSSPLFKT